MQDFNYLIIGNGRVAKHIQHYFSLLRLPFQTWHRQESYEKLAEKINIATHILLLITDQALEPFTQQYLQNCHAVCIHFSGNHVSKTLYGAHPLFCFTNTLYTIDEYLTVPFTLEKGAPDFRELLPGLSNQFVYIDPELKKKYHALCVLAGNFSCMLWQKLFVTFCDEFKFPASVVFPYLRQYTNNLVLSSENTLTGPLVRNDTQTIADNLMALKGDPFQLIYESFIKCYQAQDFKK